jgi:hypothetical protein
MRVFSFSWKEVEELQQNKTKKEGAFDEKKKKDIIGERTKWPIGSDVLVSVTLKSFTSLCHTLPFGIVLKVNPRTF